MLNTNWVCYIIGFTFQTLSGVESRGLYIYLYTTISTATSLKIAYWKQKQEKMSKCKTYEELEDLVRSVNVDHHFELSQNVHQAKMKFEVDTTAQHFYPSDRPQELTPCNCHGDGKCFPGCVSKLLFGTEDYHLAIRATLVCEAIIHKNLFGQHLFEVEL